MSNNPWIQFVKDYVQKNPPITYMCAVSLPAVKEAYKKHKEDKEKEERARPKTKLELEVQALGLDKKPKKPRKTKTTTTTTENKPKTKLELEVEALGLNKKPRKQSKNEPPSYLLKEFRRQSGLTNQRLKEKIKEAPQEIQDLLNKGLISKLGKTEGIIEEVIYNLNNGKFEFKTRKMY
jgi:hypothetical protein